jgi:hypothetical protein
MQDTDANRIAHLQMIEEVIKRMSSNSFLLKGWSLTVVAALGGLAIANKRSELVYGPLFTSLMFWCLDGYYLRLEQLFRRLYDSVRTAPVNTLSDSMFSMQTTKYAGDARGWFHIMFSVQFMLFHGVIIALSVGLIISQVA